MLFNEAGNELLILGDNVRRLDLATGSCTPVPAIGSYLQLQALGADQLFAVGFGEFVQINRETGEIVLISK